MTIPARLSRRELEPDPTHELTKREALVHATAAEGDVVDDVKPR